MSENPLLPHRKLQELHALMVRAHSLTKVPAATPRFEALLASTLMHVEVGDFVSPPPGAAAPTELAAERTAPRTRKKAAPPAAVLPTHERLTVAAGVAQGLKLAGKDRVAVVYVDAGPASLKSEPGWAEALTFAQKAGLPLLVVCADATGGARIANPRAMSWPSISALSRKTGLPVLTVDGEDAVAVYRSMQESALHSRLGAGPAIIWAVVSPGSEAARQPRNQQPLAKLEAYMKTRKIPLAG